MLGVEWTVLHANPSGHRIPACNNRELYRKMARLLTCAVHTVRLRHPLLAFLMCSLNSSGFITLTVIIGGTQGKTSVLDAWESAGKQCSAEPNRPCSCDGINSSWGREVGQRAK